MKKIKVCSLFSGVGGFEIGFEKAIGKDRVEVVFASEIDAYANAAYTSLHGLKPYGDITLISEFDIPSHDILVAGFPCQSFSSAGKRLGFEDTRGTLFFDIARIIKHKKPDFLLLENVKGLLTHDNGRTFDVIARTLSELGYKLDFQLLNSKCHGVPQNRERVFIVAMLDKGEHQKGWNMKLAKGSVLRAKERLAKDEDIRAFDFSFPKDTSDVISLRSILEEKVNDVFYLEAELEKDILKRIMKTNINSIKSLEESNNGLIFVAGATEKPNWLDNGKVLSRNFKQGSRIYDSRGLSSTLSAQGVGGIGGHTGLYLTQDNRVRRLTPLECFRLQGIPDDCYYQLKNEGFSNTRLYKMAGNAVTTNVIRDIVLSLRPLIESEEF